MTDEHTIPARSRFRAAGDRAAARLRKRAEWAAVAAQRRAAHGLAYEHWSTGALAPYRITRALDAAELYGPEVDIACGAQEPAVDEWEAGTRYPWFEQLLALAALTHQIHRGRTRQVPVSGESGQSRAGDLPIQQLPSVIPTTSSDSMLWPNCNSARAFQFSVRGRRATDAAAAALLRNQAPQERSLCVQFPQMHFSVVGYGASLPRRAAQYLGYAECSWRLHQRLFTDDFASIMFDFSAAT